MDWKSKILAQEQRSPQKLMLVTMAISQMEDAISRLAGMGHYLHVEEGLVRTELWPKTVFNRFGYSRLARCQADLDEFGPDWYESMEAARKAYGMDKQYERGGIFKRNLPDVVRTSGRVANGADG
jgi:hypothetical protein